MELVSRTARVVVPPAAQTVEKKLGSSDKSSAALTSPLHKGSPAKLDISQLALIDERVRAKILEKGRRKQNVRHRLTTLSSNSNELKKKSGEVPPSRAPTITNSSSRSVEIHNNMRSSEMLSSTKEIAPLLSSLSVKKIPSKPPKRYISNSRRNKQAVFSSNVMPPPSPQSTTKDFNRE
ncbi:unnamed protein product [Strongylus vulgaris]|uniref:Uncharacterized protein n=1 Tax=Strongylus vulgaris TaxID=40348 RepID=A0A3P7LPN8_STRVU|nr:unnamed protein product [Strongylus vulgaris]